MASSKFRPATKNSNKHTARGLRALRESIQSVGYTEPMVAAADGEILSGSARLETVADVFGVDVEPLVIHSDGTRPVIHVRDDVPNAHTPQAQRIALAANRVAELDWAPDIEILAGYDATVLEGLYEPAELSDLGQAWANAQGTPVDNPYAEWQGMPEFVQEDKNAFRSILIHFINADSIIAFAGLVEQHITDKTKSLWYPERPLELQNQIVYPDES